MNDNTSRRSIARAAGLIGLGNIASRLLGLVREMVIAAQFGTSPLTAAYIVATTVPIMIYDLLIGGLLSSALVPVFSEYATREDNNRSLWHLASLVLSLVTLLLTLLTVLVLLFAPQLTILFASGYNPGLQAATTTLIRLIAPSILFFGMSGVLTGLLYALKRFTFTAFGAAIFNLGIIIGALLISRAFPAGGNQRIIGLALGLFLGSTLQLALLLPDLRDVELTVDLKGFWHNAGLQRIVKLYIPVALSFIVSNIGVIIDRNLASHTAATQTIPWMRNATTLIQFPLGLIAAAISLAVLPNLSRLSAIGEKEGYRRTLQMGLRLVLLLIIPATIGLFLLAQPIVRLLFERGEFQPYDSYWTAIALQIYLLGLPFAAVDQLLIIAYYARQDTWTPAIVGILAVGVYLAVALPLIQPLQMLALIIANTTQHLFHALIMLILIQRNQGGLIRGSRGALLRILLAATGMGIIVSQVSSQSGTLYPGPIGNLLAVALPAIAGASSYAIFVTLLRLEEAGEIMAPIRKRLGL